MHQIVSLQVTEYAKSKTGEYLYDMYSIRQFLKLQCMYCKNI